MSGFKNSGDIEYKAWVGVQLQGDENAPELPLRLHIVKNRVRPERGYICQLSRVRKAPFFFRELGAERYEDVD
jgi:hypothetical protein